MKFIVDAQLPKALSDFLAGKGFDSIHTLQLPERNKTSDDSITLLSEKENRVVITKDTDFLDSFLLKRKPAKLILIKTGNIPNPILISLIEKNLDKIISLMTEFALIEIYQNEIVAHA